MLVNRFYSLFLKPQRIVPLLFFGLLLVLGLVVHRDYGVSWDEPTDHLNGMVNVKYIAELLVPAKVAQYPAAQLIPEFQHYRDNDHGVLFEIPMALLGYVLTHHDSRSYYFLRHFCIFLVSVSGVWATYRIGTHWLRDWRLGLLAAALLVLSPRLFAESFFNGKDIVFTALFALAIHTLMRLLEAPTLPRAIWHGVASAAAIDVRLLAIILVPYTLSLLLLAFTQASSNRTALLRILGLYLLTTGVATIIGWPYLWAHPLDNFIAAFQNLSHYPWIFTNLYKGQFLAVKELPWHYAPVWIFITTPLPYSLLAFVGIVASGKQLWNTGWRGISLLHNRFNVLLIGWLLGPLVVIVVLHSALYDAWRHVYFVYPAFVLLAARGVQMLITWGSVSRPTLLHRLALFLLLVAGLETIRTAIRMVRLHPYEHLYYSFLPAKTIEQQFERDYWALSFRQGLEWLLAHDSSAQVGVSVTWPHVHPLYNNGLILPAAQRARIVYVPKPQRGRYHITTYRWHPQPYADSLGREIYSIRAEGITILSIFDREAH
ncbi:hypothetical protein MUN82_17765 [Hymenobacter aerilatus]|uniref:Glycosyltransferase RgtA/B/C/D-like domain-containing protein n=1 Tax=Hymenobacter aerilatus TaxID=2932251 RepID=A0A8T9SX75_9BACT|nr:hypothetical protein [Hymenobacter aerilatus]UOR04780.1 hypothetical protein MUN82_17765 [Hymenobacter aerilatus]